MRLAVALAFFLVAGTAAADPRIDQAKREGEVVWYTAMTVADAEAVLKPFRERYPFLEISLLRAQTAQLRSSVLGDAREGRFSWDLVSTQMVDIDALNRAGVLGTYVSPETRSGFPPGTVDPEGRWAAIYVLHYVLAYNTRLVAAADVPKSWSDVLSPRWKGQLAIEDTDAEWYAAMLDYLGRDKGRAFTRSFAQLKPQAHHGHSLLAQQLSNGEVPLAINHLNQIEKQRLAGAPVNWVKTMDPVIASPSQVAVSAKAPHPVAARLLIDYLLSREGQRAIASRGRIPARNDVPESQIARQLKVHYIDPHLAPQMHKYEVEFERLLAKPR
jgi:iron(III) transport system substrate-binding protein